MIRRRSILRAAAPRAAALPRSRAVAQTGPARSVRRSGLGTIVPPPMEPDAVEAFYRSERAIWIPAGRATGARAG